METVKVIKIGGKVAEQEQVLDQFLNDFNLLEGSKILVHGGGVLASQLSEKLGIETQMIDGRRVTNKETLEVVTMVYGGLINKRLVAKLQALKQNAVGLTGADLNIIQAKKRNSIPIDFGWVGDVEKVHTFWLENLLQQQVVPVLAPLTHDGSGNLLNTNADNIAGFIASALTKKFAVELIFCFDRPGVMNGNNVVSKLNAKEYQELKEQKIISDGMLPKLELAFQARLNSVKKVVIKHVADLTNEESGTQIV